MNKHRHVWRIEGTGPQKEGDTYLQKCKVCNQTRNKRKKIDMIEEE